MTAGCWKWAAERPPGCTAGDGRVAQRRQVQCQGVLVLDAEPGCCCPGRRGASRVSPRPARCVPSSRGTARLAGGRRAIPVPILQDAVCRAADPARARGRARAGREQRAIPCSSIPSTRTSQSKDETQRPWSCPRRPPGAGTASVRLQALAGLGPGCRKVPLDVGQEAKGLLSPPAPERVVRAA